MPAETAWRWMFALGALPALLVLYMRAYVDEPEIAVRSRITTSTRGGRLSPLAIFQRPILKTTVLASLMTAGCQGGYYAITFWAPQYLVAERSLPLLTSSGYLAALISGSFAGYLVGAWFCDRYGRRRLFLTFALGAIATVFTYTQAPISDGALWLLGVPLGFFSTGYYSGIGAFLTELFPTRLRGSGQGFCYSFGRGIGAIFPFMVGKLSETTSLADAICLFAVSAYVIFFSAAYLLPETRGRVLSAED